MVHKITKVNIRFDFSNKTFVTFNRRVWADMPDRGIQGLVQHNIWRVTIKRNEKRKVKNLIKALYLCVYRKEVILEQDGYSMFFYRRVNRDHGQGIEI